jgi:hypothetical protein
MKHSKGYWKDRAIRFAADCLTLQSLVFENNDDFH